jgi:hypothetical protein|tara:strand:+ start:45 stop:467 length:423 start_codon:yes stop_codon:yes gene_type:complete
MIPNLKKDLKSLLYAVLITLAFIFVFVKSVEAEGIHDNTTVEEILLADELLDKEMAIMVLGGIDYYVQECSPLTPRGVLYRNEIISYHELKEDFLPISPTYIKGALAVSGYNCQEMYELVVQLDDSNLAEEPISEKLENK